MPLAGKRAEEFVAKRNQEKGGHWSLHTPAQYDLWWKAKGQFLEYLSHS